MQDWGSTTDEQKSGEPPQKNHQNTSWSTGRNEDRRQNGAEKEPKSTRVFVGNLSFETSNETLKSHMLQAGEVVSVRIFVSPDGKSKGCGYEIRLLDDSTNSIYTNCRLVEYATTSDVAKAIQQLHRTELDGRKIFVREVIIVLCLSIPYDTKFPFGSVQKIRADNNEKLFLRLKMWLCV